MKDADKFKSEREDQFGGKIRFMTYARLIGEAAGNKMINRGGIMFVINDTLHFEDFERSGGLMVLLNQKEDYTKTEFAIDLKDLTIIKEIKEKHAVNCVKNLIDENEIAPVSSGWVALFSKKIIQIVAEGQKSLFFDVLEKDGFINLVNDFMHQSD